MDKALRQQRESLQRSWRARVSEGGPGGRVRPDVLSSWRRSAETVNPGLAGAPVAPPETVVRQWEESPLGRASRVILDDLRDLAADGDLMAAITDETVTIAWAAGGRTMSKRADQVHFTRGGCWSEGAVGTNALALASHTIRPATVFSAEHFAPMVHDWVCYSAPITEPSSGRLLGVLDLSTAWDRAHPALLTTVSALARCVHYELAATQHLPGLRPGARAPTPLAGGSDSSAALIELTTLGSPSLRLGGHPVAVTRRQLELLTVLSLHPEGLSLDELTGYVYGDHPVGRSTVKAELSHLRHLLGGRIASRPYRLIDPVDVDHRRLLQALRAGDLGAAVSAYQGQLLVASDSPEIDAWRHHIDVAIRDAVMSGAQADLLYRLSEHCRDDVQLQTAALEALGPGDARHSLAAGRLAAARRC